MTSPFPGVPIGAEPDQPTHGRPVYRRVPRLRDHLRNGGWPGVVYAQVCVHNLKAAADRVQKPARLRELTGGQIYFTIQGPKGAVEMALVGTGKPIPGASPDAGNRLFFTDGEVEKWTGLPVQYPIWLRPQEEDRGQEVDVSSDRDRTGQGPQGDVGVQGGDPALGIRAARDLAQASGRDRPVRGGSISPEERLRRSERMKAMHARKREEKNVREDKARGKGNE